MSVSKEKSAKAMWDKLCSEFETKSVGNRLALRRQLFAIHMAEGEDVGTHINKIRKLVDQLASIGYKVVEEDVIMTLLDSLPRSFESFVVALSNREDFDQLTDSKVIGLVLQEATRLQSKASGTTSTETALVAHKGGPQITSSNPKKKLKCHYSGKKGHFEHECRQGWQLMSRLAL